MCVATDLALVGREVIELSATQIGEFVGNAMKVPTI